MFVFPTYRDCPFAGVAVVLAGLALFGFAAWCLWNSLTTRKYYRRQMQMRRRLIKSVVKKRREMGLEE